VAVLSRGLIVMVVGVLSSLLVGLALEDERRYPDRLQDGEYERSDQAGNGRGKNRFRNTGNQ